MLAMRRAAFLPALPLLGAMLAGCPTFEGPPWSYSPYGEGCETNNPPVIGNVEVNSFYVVEWETWMFSIHFDWVDPGVEGAEDVPNMLGGRFTAEMMGADAEDADLTRTILENACTWPPPEGEDPDPCDLSGHSMTGCPSGSVDACNQGEITRPYLPDWLMQEDDVIQIEFRVRDACDATSNEKAVTYVIGSGMAVEGGGEEGGG